MNKRWIQLILVIWGLTWLLPSGSQAQSFNPNRVISDSFLDETGTMSVSEIQSFLETQTGRLATYRAKDIYGQERLASEIIAAAAAEFNLNPRFLLALLEKEQGLLSNSTPTTKALDWATGFGDFGNKKYQGFGAQVYYAGKVMGRDYDLYADYYRNFQVGRESTTEDGYKVKPETNATRKCYIYNPLVGGPQAKFGANWLLWHLLEEKYADTFAHYNGSVVDTKSAVSLEFAAGKYFYRDGTAIKVAGDPAVYVVQGGWRYHFTGPNALRLRYRTVEVVAVSREEFSTYPDGGAIGLPDGVVVQRQKGGAVYVVENGKLRGIPSLKVLRQLGYSPAQIIKVTDQEINSQPAGEPVSAVSPSRLNGQLVRIEGQGAVYRFENEKLYPIWDHQIKAINFQYQPVVNISKAEAAGYEIGRQPVLFRDGTLLVALGGPARGVVFVVAGGRRYGFTSREAFNDSGYQMNNVMKVSNKLLQIVPAGARAVEE